MEAAAAESLDEMVAKLQAADDTKSKKAMLVEFFLKEELAIHKADEVATALHWDDTCKDFIESVDDPMPQGETSISTRRSLTCVLATMGC